MACPCAWRSTPFLRGLADSAAVEAIRPSLPDGEYPREDREDTRVIYGVLLPTLITPIGAVKRILRAARWVRLLPAIKRDNLIPGGRLSRLT